MAFLDERRILGTSETFIQVEFIVFSSASSSPSYSNNKLILTKNYIQSAEFSGVEIGARKGKIVLVDPEGVWAQNMNHIGAWKNNSENAGKANMIVKFGWTGLAGGGTGSDSINQSIQAIMLKTAFSMSDNGTINIEINFIENSENILNIIQFKTLDDMRVADTEVNPDLKSYTIDRILRHICSNCTSISTQLNQYGVTLSFEATYETDETNYGHKEIKIRPGDNLGSKMNELIANAMPDPSWSTDYTYSYEIMKTKPYEFSFKWKKSPKNPPEGFDAEVNAMGIVGDPPASGPTLMWKKQSNEASTKLLLDFSVDLKMLDYAASMIKSELDKRLSNFSQEKWDKIAEVVAKLPADSPFFRKDPKALAAYYAEQKARDPSFKGLDPSAALAGGGWGGPSDDEKENNREITGAVEEFNEVLASASSNTENQIQTIIDSNVFKAKARIMGDPTIGTENLVYKFAFPTNFQTVGLFASFFERAWMLTGSFHKIEEGGYFTEIDLLALPIKTTVAPRGGGRSMA